MMMRTIVALATAIACAGTVAVAQGNASRNLQTCLSGKYPALCDHSLLTSEQLRDVKAAEKRENLSLCMTGKYSALCNHSLLTAEEVARVQQAERAENLKICVTGKYATLCNHNLLTAEQAQAAAEAEARLAMSRPSVPMMSPSGFRAGRCESGHWIDSVAGNGKVIKLEDGSMWLVNDMDTVTTSIWLPVSDVVVCGTKMINVDDKESAEVTPMNGRVSAATTGQNSLTQSYPIEASANDETLVINGEVFKAKTYCFNFEKGARVIFIEGSPLGACASAKLLNVRTNQVCEVWCE